MYKFYFRFHWSSPALLAFFAGLMFLSSRYFGISAAEFDGAVFIAIHLAIVGGFARFFYDGATWSQQAKAGLIFLFFAMLLGALGNLLSPSHAFLEGFKFFFSWVQLAIMYVGAASATLVLYRLDKLPKEASSASGQSSPTPEKPPESAPQASQGAVTQSDSIASLSADTPAGESAQSAEAQTIQVAKRESAT